MRQANTQSQQKDEQIRFEYYMNLFLFPTRSVHLLGACVCVFLYICVIYAFLNGYADTAV